MKRKKILSLILAFMMVISTFPAVNAQVEEGDITAELTQITTSTGELSPAFDADTLYYKIELDNLDETPEISADAAEGYTVAVVQPSAATQYVSAITVTNNSDSDDAKTYYVRLVPAEGQRIVPVAPVEALSSPTKSGYSISEAVDSNPDTVSGGNVEDSIWISDNVENYAYFTVDLGRVMDVTKAYFRASSDNASMNNLSKLYVSNDGVTFTEATSGTRSQGQNVRDDIYNMGGRYAQWTFSSPVEARYLKVESKQAEWASIKVSYTTVYARTFADTPVLESLSVDEDTHTLSPSFDPDIYDYTVEVDDLTSLPQLSAAAPAGYTAVVTQMAEADSYSDNYVARIKVTNNEIAFDEKVYTVRALSTQHDAMLPLTYQESGCTSVYNSDYASFEGGIGLSDVAASYISRAGENGCYTIDLGGTAKINEIRYNQRMNQSQTSYSSVGDTNEASVASFEKIEISADGISFTDITDKAVKTSGIGNDNLYNLSFYQISFKLSEQVQARYIRVSNDDGKSLWINGTEVFGKIIHQVFLDSLSTDKGTLSPSFDKAIFEYKVIMDNLDDEPVLTALPETGIEILENIQPSLANGYVGSITVKNSETGRRNTYTVRVIYPDVEEEIEISGYEEGSSEGFTGDISYGIDGSDEETEWSSGESLKPRFAAELAQASNITKVRFYQKTSSDSLKRISVSADGSSFTDVTEFAEITSLGNDAALNKWGKEYYATEFAFPVPITATYVRVENNDGNIIKLHGTAVYGYTKKVSSPKLKDLSAHVGELTPSFDKNIYSYNLLADDMENIPVISGLREYADYEALKVIQPSAENGYKGKLLISSGRGAAAYVVNVYENTGVPLKDMSVLKNISLSTEGAAFSTVEGFSKETLDYSYTIAKKNVFPKVRAAAVYDGATVLVEQATAENPFAKITVTSESKESTTVYTINFVYIQKITLESRITREIVPYYDMCTQKYKGESVETAIDGGDGYSNSWKSVSGEEAMYTIDLGMLTDVTKIVYWQNTGSTGRAAYEDLEISKDGINFVNVSASGAATRKNLGWKDHPVWNEHYDGIQYSFSTPTEARYIKIGNDDRVELKINGIDVYENIYPAYLETLNTDCGIISPQFDSAVFQYDLTVDSYETIPVISGTAKEGSEIIKTEQPSAENGYIGNIKVYDTESGKTNTYTFSVVFPDTELNLNITGYEKGTSIGYKGTLEAGIDGSDKESSFSTSSALKPRFAVALDKLSNITRVMYYQDTGEAIQSHFDRISVSRDGIVFVDVTEFAKRTDAGWDQGENRWGHNYYVTSFEFDTPITAKYVRVENNSGDILNIKGTEVYGYNEKIVAPALKNISMNFGELIPSFSKDIYSYDVLLEDISKLPRIIGESEFLDTEKTTVIKPSQENNSKGKILLASNRGASVYIVKMYEDRGIALEDLTELSSISLSFDGVNYSELEDFEKDSYSYAYPIRNNQTIPNVRAVAAYDEATVVIEQATEENPVARIIVTSESKEVTDVYTIGFVYNIALNQSSWCSSGDPFGGVDGDLNTRWKTNTMANGGGFFAVSMGGLCRVYAMTLYSQLSNPAYFDRVYVSKDASEFELLEGVTVTRTGSIVNDDGITLYEFEYEFPEEYMDIWAVKVRGQDSYKLKSEIYELEIYGEKLYLVSGESRLRSLTLDTGILADFSPNTQTYTVEIPASAPVPAITEALPESEAATVEITQATEENPVATVTVTAQNAVSKTTYTIHFVREVDPADNNYLSLLSVAKGKMVPEFSKAVNSYNVYIEESDGVLEKSDITAVKESENSSLSISEDGMTFTVTSQNGDDNIYTVTPLYSSSRLTALTATGYTLSPEFTPATTAYTVQLAEGEDIPVINTANEEKLVFAQCAENAAMVIKDATSDYPVAVITVTDETGYLKSSYTIIYERKQNLSEAQAAVLEKLSGISVTNSTDLDVLSKEILSAVKNDSINTVYQLPLSITKATSTKNGAVTGTLKLSCDGNSAIVKINLVIEKTGSSASSGGSGGGGGGTSFPSTTFPNSISTVSGTKTEAQASSETITKENQEAIRGHWAEKEATALVEKGIIKGKDGSYALEDKVTRAEFVTMLLRTFELDEMAYNGGFADVSGNEWYAGVISAAHSMGLFNGSEGKAYPNNVITREESVKLLVSFAEKNKGELEASVNAEFKDEASISPWAKEYVQKAVSAGFIKGMGDNEFMPKGTLTRAQAMVMIYRIIAGV